MKIRTFWNEKKTHYYYNCYKCKGELLTR